MKKLKILTLALLIFSVTSCATHISKPKNPPQTAKLKFGTFSNVEIKEAVLAPRFADSSANKKAAKKINELLEKDMKDIFPNSKFIKDGQSFSTSGKTLHITPIIKEVKFISGAARFWVGAMAGSSAILMQVTYSDNKGSVIADPEFYRAPGAYHGALTFGGADNRMLKDIVSDIASYSSSNK